MESDLSEPYALLLRLPVFAVPRLSSQIPDSAPFFLWFLHCHRFPYGKALFQCSEPCHKETYDNEDAIKKMVLSQGFQIKDGELQKPEDGELKLTVPTGLIPYCPRCGKPMSMNLRSDQTFVEDEGWHRAAERYEKFIQNHKKLKIVFLELGVGYNTPGIIKYPFWQMANTFPHAFYVCLNQGEAYAPEELGRNSVCMNEDIGEVLKEL